jgi:Tol biopolymer transport system component
VARTFDFQVLKTENFDIYYYPSERAGVEIAARMAERWHVRLGRMLQHRLRGRQPLVLYASHVDFEQTNVIGGEIGEGTGGVTESARRRIVLPLSGPLSDTDHVIGHELVHAFQFDMLTSDGDDNRSNHALILPLWFIEGMAEYLSIGPVDANTAMWLRDAARREKLPAIKDLGNPKYFPYRWGQAFWAYVGGRWGDEVIGPLLLAAAQEGVDPAIERVLGVTTKQLSIDWHASILATYLPVLTATSREPVPARVVIEGKELGSDLNIAPSLSPDGRRLAFLSARGFFSVDLYIADVATGEVARRLTSTSTNPHFSSLQFVQSAGAWDRTGQQLAVATVKSGLATLAIFNGTSGSLVREIEVRAVDEIMGPTWAPDGRALAFTGLSEGLTDLYIYDLDKQTVRRLTYDAYADLQPAWSPDGRMIAFATDRFSTSLGSLSIGSYQLALLDVASGRIDRGPSAGVGKQINPQWSPDSRSLYFVSDREGLSNVYRAALDNPEEIQQLTTVITGVSGITSSSPAISVASTSGHLAFSVYQGGKYDILTIANDAVGSFGAVGPVQGQRYRFEAAPTFGTLNFTGVLVDYRRYFMPAPFYTLAVRGMQYGRYGSGSEDTRLVPLYIGYPWLVRGYDAGSIGIEECVVSPAGSCDLVDRLRGSRMLVGNVELRFPVLRPFGVSSNMYGPLPVEVALFADAGTAWYADQRPSVLRGSRAGVTSAGVAVRVNLLGFAVGEFDFIQPFQRPGRGWVFDFNFMPAW